MPKHDLNPALQTALDASGIRYELEENYAIDKITSHLQVRHDTDVHGNAKFNVGKANEYANRFRNGSVPPPIGVTRDGVQVWGNHRVYAAGLADVTHLPAIVLNVDGTDPDSHMRDTLVILSGRENSQHGLSLTPKDRELVVRSEIAAGHPSGVIQRTYGISAAQVSSLKRLIDAENRLSEVGLRLRTQRSPRAVLQAFSGPDARSLTDPPFKALVELSIDADLSPKEINGIADEAAKKGTEDAQTTCILEHRAAMDRRIKQVEVTGTVDGPDVEPPPPLTRLRKALTEVHNLCTKNEAAAYRDYTVDAGNTKERIEEAIGCLQAILAAQDA